MFPVVSSTPDLGVDVRRGPFDADTVVAEVLGRLRDPAQRGRSIAVLAGSPALANRMESLLEGELTSYPDELVVAS